jgi:hypothetical protein
MKWTATSLVALLVFAGCSESRQEPTGASAVVSDTANNLEELRSGELELSVLTTSAPGADGSAEAGFELSGTFQLPDEGSLPVADLEFTDLGSDEPISRGFISTGEAAFIEVDGQAYELSDEQSQGLIGGSGDGDALFEGVDIGGWFVDAELKEGESLDGEQVDTVTGDLDVVLALNDLFEIAERFGSPTTFGSIEGDEAERLQNAVRSSSIEIASGSEDRLLRHLLIEVDLALDEGLSLAESLGPLAGASFTIEMDIGAPNEEVEVEAPADALPFEQLGAP